MAVPAGRPLAVVTGASSGIGYELAGQFARSGFDLIVAAHDNGIAGAARDFEASGGQAIPVQADLARHDGVENLYLAIQSTACPVAALAISAQAVIAGDFVRDSQLAGELRQVSVNVAATVHLTRRVLADMIARDAGSVLLAFPAAATAPGPCHATYAASTAFLHTFAAELARELQDTAVTITALAPLSAELARLGDVLASYVPLAGSPGRTTPVS